MKFLFTYDSMCKAGCGRLRNGLNKYCFECAEERKRLKLRNKGVKYMKIIKIEEEGIVFDNGTNVEDNHDQGCCENVYADWKQLNDTDILSKEFDDIKIEGVEDSGFKLNGYFVPCYNSQNGYYGSDLELIITNPDKTKIIIDVSEFVEDQID